MLDLERQIHDYVQHLDEITPRTSLGMVIERAPAQPRVRPIVAFAGAAILVLVIFGIVVLASPFRSNDRPVIEPATTTLPVTTATTAQPTSTQPPTTTTEAAVPLPVITWTRIDDPVFDGPMDQSGVSVRHIGSAFYIVGNDLDNKSGVIWRSEDGTTWERFDDPDVFGGPPGVHEITDIAGNDSIIFALGYEGNEALLDLGNLDHPPYGSDEAWCRGVVWVSEDDGHTWARLPHEEAFGTEDGFCEVDAVVSTPNGFLAIYHGVWTSQDGLHWTTAAEVPNGGVVWDLAMVPSGFVGVGQVWITTLQASAWWSTDGIDWIGVSNKSGQFDVGADIYSWLEGVVDTGNGLVAVGTARDDPYRTLNAAVWISNDDGHTWWRVQDPGLEGYHEEVMNDVLTVGDLLIAVGEASNYPAYWPQPLPDWRSIGAVWTSEDHGLTWHRMDNPDRVFGSYVGDWIKIEAIVASGNRFVAAGYDGTGVAVWVGTIEEGEGQ